MNAITKATPAKKTAKKTAKKAAPKAAPVVAIAPEAVTLNKQQTGWATGILRNQERIYGKATDMIKLAIDSGHKLIQLKDAMKAKKVNWKAWFELNTDVLGISYKQATKYMKVSAHEQAVLDGDFTSINEAYDAIGHENRSDEQNAALEDKRTEKRAQAKVTNGVISERTFDEIDNATDIGELKIVIRAAQERIDALQAAKEAGKADDAGVIEGDYSEADDAADIETALS